MYALVRKYYVMPTKVEAFMQWLQDSFVPLLSQAQGFVTYYVLKAGNEEVITFTSFDSRAAAEAASPLKAAWLAHMGPLFLQGLPETAAGEVGVCSDGQDQGVSLESTRSAETVCAEEIKGSFPELFCHESPLMGII